MNPDPPRTERSAQAALLDALLALRAGDFSVRLPHDWPGIDGKIADAVNDIAASHARLAASVARVANAVGTEGKLGQRLVFDTLEGAWGEEVDAINAMIDNLVQPVREVGRVIGAVARGVLLETMQLEIEGRPLMGEFLKNANTINTMLDQLNSFSIEVARVAREVGTEGKLGGQAQVEGAFGVWRDLTDNVNLMASKLTGQVRDIAAVTTAVAQGDLSRKITADARGEVLALKETINTMVDQLNRFAGEVTRVAREVGTEGKLGGQADVKGVSGVWKDLTENVNLMANNLTDQVRNIAEVTTAVASGDLSRKITVDVQGEIQRLKDTINLMVDQLNSFAGEVTRVAREVGTEGKLGGQAAFEKQRLLVTNVPDDYIQIVSGLGRGKPRNIVVLPILFEGQVKAVIELAAFEAFQAIHLNFLDQLSESLGIVFNSIETAASTEMLLRQQAQKLEGEFTQQQARLQESNAELERKAQQLSDQNTEVERKNREIEDARRSLQEKAEQLSLTSKYKSEFLANMSHELRSPLNSLLLLAEQLRQNRDHNLSEKQLEMVKVMHASGRDLLHVINDILDLSKIEAGSATLDIGEIAPATLAGELDKTFRYQCEARGLAFAIDFAPDLPPLLRTDVGRVKQVLTNLLSNALKFTSKGGVTLSARVAHGGWSLDKPGLAHAPLVIAFSVVDIGIGIADAKRKMIFEAFQQADASTSRRYGGTGLGLAISREIARLLDGELGVQSREGAGSTFTFYLPQQLAGVRAHPNNHGAPAAHPDPAPAPAPLLLIIEDDPVFARTLQDMAHERGFDTLVASGGEEGFLLARRDRPDAITLDLELPDADGWDIADRLKQDPATAAIPVHVISVRDRPGRSGRHGVASYTTKPADLATLAEVFAGLVAQAAPPIRVLLLVGSDLDKRAAITAVLAGPERAFDSVANAADALAALRQRRYQGIVIALDLPDEDGMALLRRIRGDPLLRDIPAVLYVERALDAATLDEVAHLDAALVGAAEQPAAAQAEAVAAFLQRVRQGMAGATPQQQETPTPADDVLAGKCALIVDDDVRNLFALTGLLESAGMDVNAVESGAEALHQLDTRPGIDIVLMDIMMPEMDGYEAMRRIRADPRFTRLPVIALTANAMLEDRARCLAAGASDYASKPVDTEQLLAQLRSWLGETASQH